MGEWARGGEGGGGTGSPERAVRVPDVELLGSLIDEAFALIAGNDEHEDSALQQAPPEPAGLLCPG